MAPAVMMIEMADPWDIRIWQILKGRIGRPVFEATMAVGRSERARYGEKQNNGSSRGVPGGRKRKKPKRIYW